MNISSAVLKAEHVGIREFKDHLSIKLLSDTRIITDRGKPVSVNMPYEDLMEIIDLIDELSDPKTLALVAAGRKAIRAGAKGIPVERLFRDVKTGKK
jgi:hypothetical protein